MLTKDNFKQLLLTLNFNQNDQLFSKSIGNAIMQVDFANEKLIYPTEVTIHEHQTCNFKAAENFVVFECVHRLLEKGYQPEHIELEPKWQVGHGASGGRADIMVRDYQNTPFLIIECKTYGREFNNAWRDTLDYGGQVFSYVEQEKSVGYVCLYASDLQENEGKKTIQLQQKIITVKDNEDLVKNNPNEISFAKATNVKQRFKVWQTVYKSEAAEVGIFEPNIAAYTVGKNKYTLEHDTSTLIAENMRGKYHEFRTILRTFNVSRRENAFEVLVNLFLCKIVDEKNNPDDLNFYWKGIAIDDYFKLVDRLQRLYQQGMKDYLKQDITYVSEEEIKNAFWAVKKGKNSTQLEILKLFHELKYYKGLDFDFIKVTNKENFDKNAKILIKIIQMWQNLRLTSNEQNQFLGDMFEYFLDNGVKQSEGQFFTPIPICKFIVSSLPLEEMISDYEKPLKVIDYACGSGHFLTEYAEHASHIVKHIKQIEDVTPYYEAITGIEKEDRLAKVAKVAAFMHGRNEIKVMDSDALAENKDIKNNDFDVLIANPPFAVEDFLTTLNEEERENFSLMELVNNIGTNNIQCFFLERTAQLMRASGVIGVIVPSSILSNTDNIHIRTREILLSYFDFISITELGSQTFGKTGTNTVVLFLRRKSERPEQLDLFKERVESYFNDFANANQLSIDVFGDGAIIKAYCDYQEIAYSVYLDVLQNQWNDDLFEHELFKNYQDEFNKSTEIINLKKQKRFTSQTKDQQIAELNKKLLNNIRIAEQDKILFFMLTRQNQQSVLIVKTPSDNKAQKAFLGYEWSSAKGNEGLKYKGGDTVNSIITPMFDPKDRLNPNKLSYLIHQNFIGEVVTIPNELNEFVSQVNLTDMLDFSRTTLDKAIRTSVQKKTVIESKYPLERLGDVCKVSIGGTPSRKISEYFTGDNLWVSISEMNGQPITDTKEKITNLAITDSNVKLIPKGTTLLSFKLSIGKTAIAGADLYTNEAIAGLIPIEKDKISNKYLFHLFNGKLIDLENVGNKAFGKSLNSTYLKDEVKIPLPPLDIQDQIVAECEKIDNEYESNLIKIKELENKINDIFENLTTLGEGIKQTYRLNNSNIFNLSIGKRVLQSEVLTDSSMGIPVYSANVFQPFGFINKDTLTDFSKPSVLWGIDGDWMVNTMPANMEFYPTDHCGVIQVDESYFNYKYLAFALRKAGEEIGFSRSKRASIDRISSISVTAPPIDLQNKGMEKVLEIESKIHILEQTMTEIIIKKQAVLNKYLT